MLLDAGVVVDACDIEGKTPLHYAVVSNPQLAKLLVEGGKRYSIDMLLIYSFDLLWQ